MKISDVISDVASDISESQVVNALKTVNWGHELSDDVIVFLEGQREMRNVENLVFKFWKQNPDRALQLWHEHCPYVAEQISTPSFIYKLKLYEEAPSQLIRDY